MNEQETKAQREEVIKKADAAKDTLVAALEKYPSLKVTAKWLYPDTQYPKWNVQVASASPAEDANDRFHEVTNICVDKARWSSSFTVSIERHTGRGGRGAKRHYKAMTPETAAKIAKDAYESQQLHINYEISRRATDNITSQWQAIRHAKLKDYTIHPMMTVSIIETGKAPTAADSDNPMFQVDFSRYSTPMLSNYRFTRSQVQELAACIARITGLGEHGENKFAIISRDDAGRIHHFDGHMLHEQGRVTNGQLRAKIYDTQAEAQKDVDMLASRANTLDKSATVVPFSAIRI